MDSELFSELVSSIEEMSEINSGKLEAINTFDGDNINVKEIRNKTGLSQSKFSSLLGVSLATLRNWEQGRRKPQGPSRALLQIVQFNPMMVLQALNPKLI